MDYGKDGRVTKRIRVYGIVQGVGFRPLVYRIAQKHNIKGTVQNVGGYVEIVAQSKIQELEQFLQELKNEQSGSHEIVKIEVEVVMESEYADFTIIRSGSCEEVSIIPPDLPVCSECQKELYLQSDRRYHNPFISCMSCGPRYTILEELPYDRENTTMTDFSMCESCHEEYTSPASRRFHAQTISCNDCGPYLIYQENTEQDCVEEKAFHQAVEAIRQGGIIAVKGIGGYHFVCSPFLEATVRKLRKLKGREEKPFAVMFETMETIRAYCQVSEEEQKLLETKPRPIVLLYIKEECMAPSTNRGSIYCGAFLPYTPLQLLLTKQCGPLIMTSANLSGKPIIREDAAILALQSPYLNGILYNKRRIVRSVDDSVAKIIDGKPQIIRRSRGYVPYPVFLSEEKLCSEYDSEKENLSQESLMNGKQSDQEEPIVCDRRLRKIFAAGGDLKAAFCLYQNGSAVVSQYFGDLEEVDVMKEYSSSVTDLSRMLMVTPNLAMCDLHPNYHSSHYARGLGIPVLEVQHHHAHIASVMAEHQITGPVIGVAFDGTGYGTDGNIWGGEFLLCEGAGFRRAGHLSYIPILGGDQSMKDAKKTASCYLLHAGLEHYCRDDRRDILQSAIKCKVNTILTSSMGRLFDAVASILLIAQENRYEGECAASLEREAIFALRNNVKSEELAFAIHEKDEIIEIDSKPLLEQLCTLREARNTRSLALGFHYAVAEMIGKTCEMLRAKQNCNVVALSGGVFQNTIVTEQALKILREKGFEVYTNMAVPPNDGCISLGQTYIGLMK